MSDKAKLEALTRMLMEELSGAPRAKPRLSLVGSEPPPAIVDDEITRASRVNRIRWLAKAYRLQWLVEQHCFGCAGIESLGQDALRALHRDMEIGRECVVEGNSFDDAGLVRKQAV